MAILKRGARKIVVDGTGYRWNVRRKPTYCQGLAWGTISVAVERSDCHGSVLIGTLPQFHSGNWVGKPVVPVSPGQVATLVREAVSAGWKAEKAGKPFPFQGAGD